MYELAAATTDGRILWLSSSHVGRADDPQLAADCATVAEALGVPVAPTVADHVLESAGPPVRSAADLRYNDGSAKKTTTVALSLAGVGLFFVVMVGLMLAGVLDRPAQ